MMTEVILVKAVQTCQVVPSQWDAWDADGNYWYLRYRGGRGTAERQPSPDLETWTWKPDGDILFTWDDDWRIGSTDDIGHDYISLAEFCRRSGLNLHPDAEIRR